MAMSEEERRREYKKVWTRKNRAKKKPGYDEAYWDAQLDALKKYSEEDKRPSQDKEYHREKARITVAKASNSNRRFMTNRWHLNRLLEDDETTVSELMDLVERIDQRLKEG
ncbi:hypothetical protein GPK34_00380 [Secundilactobacillus kimchicus]|uniref:hypothetical protein n=1 Tax=Secundilactobacillus kimchicus TaxID=528209 RepID=UPI001C01719A|nr:hypothetical protein [Secundilactobacillus kimchicus]MBT9670493.1 hypothetical protein [Secundilactobacillus kimchicus]